MNLQELDKLIDRFYKGTSTESEETQLLEWMSREDLPPEYATDISLLKGMRADEYINEPDAEFESRIMSAIDKAANEKKIVSIKRRLYSAVSVAATLLIIISSYLLLRDASEPQDTFDDPILAYNATLEVLERVGRTLNTGSDVISELSIISKTEQEIMKLSEPARIINREMESLKYIEKSMDILDPLQGKGNIPR